jgi:signal transduction histidine kinase
LSTIGWVAQNKKSKMLNDVSCELNYKKYLKNTKSALCVPLLDEEQKGIVGVLNVESTRINAFDSRDRRRLVSLANRIIISLQKVQSDEKRVADERIASLNHIARSVFHRMNNHLGLIKVRAQQIIEGKFSSAAGCQKLAREILFEAAQAQENTKNMKSWLYKLEPIDVADKLKIAYSRTSVFNNIKSNFNVLDDLPKVMGNPIQLEDVFYNLIQNSLEAMPKGGELTITAMEFEKNIQKWVVVQIIDTGIGISERDIDHIYERNFTTKKEDHHGEGLWLTKAYVEKLGGNLLCKSSPSKGTKFTILLPAYQVKSN